MKHIIGVIFFFLCLFTFYGQEVDFRKHTIGGHFEHSYHSKLQISQEPHLNMDGTLSGNGLYSSIRALRNMGSIYYQRHLNEYSALGIEFFVGRDNSFFRIQMSEEFLDHEVLDEILIDGFLDNSIVPLGLTLFYNHRQRLHQRSFLDFVVGISGLYFDQEGGSVIYGTYIDGQLHTYFLHQYEINPKNRIIPALYLSATYNYDITPLIGVRAGAQLRHSNSTILQSEVPYEIIGHNETITGNYRKKFSQFGWRFGLYFNFGQ